MSYSSAPTFPQVVVATVSWNQKGEVLSCLDSLTRLDYPRYEILVVDNASTDGTFEAVREKFPRVHLIRHTENLGCAEGFNQALRYALREKADYLLVVDSGGTVEASALAELTRAAESDSKVGAASPQVYDSREGHWVWFAGAESPLTGRFCLIRMEAVKRVGFWDPEYFIYFEDQDWFMRLRRAGFTGRFVPEAKAWHRPHSAIGFDSPRFHYYQTRNRLYFSKKHSPPFAFPFFFGNFLFGLFFKTLPELERSGRRAQARAVQLGLFDFLRGKRGPRDLSAEAPTVWARLARRGVDLWRNLTRRVRFTVKRSLRRPLFIRVYMDWNVGDEIIALPAYEALKKKYPDSVIEVQTRHPDLLKGNPFVDRVNPRESLEPDRVVDLHRSPPGTSRIDFIRRLVGVSSLPEPKVYLTGEEILRVKEKWLTPTVGFRIAVCASLEWFFARQWEKNKLEEVVDYLIRRHNAQIFILGKNVEPLPVGINLINQTNLREAAALLSQCDLFMGSDSGLLHLALAVRTPSVGLFGPLNPAYLISGRPSFIPLYSEVECRGCWSEGRMKYRDHCPKIVPDCMTSISTASVIQAAEKLLTGSLIAR